MVSGAVADPPPPAAEQAPAAESASASASSPASQRSEAEFKAAVQHSIELLGSREFAARERAAEELMELGVKTVPTLLELANHPDPEVRLRAADLVQQLSEGDFQRRVDDFLSGKDVHFDGWDYFQARLGMSSTMRELFISLTKRYPTLVEALEGTPRDRAEALDALLQSIQTALFVERRSPDHIDVIALLLPVTDTEIPVVPAAEKLIVIFLQRQAGTRILEDPRLNAPVTAMIGNWVERSSERYRVDVILLAMQWSVPEVYNLAVRTLSESRDTPNLAVAMQAISKFGTTKDDDLIAKFLDDTRPLEENGFLIDNQPQVLMGDVAMAAIAVLHKQPMADFGWENAEPHPKTSFNPISVGFPPNQPELRAKAREKVNALLTNPASKG